VPGAQEGGAVHRHGHVGGEGHPQTDAGRHAVDGGEDRPRQVDDLVQHLVPEHGQRLEVGADLVGLPVGEGDLLEVESRREGVLARSRQHDRADVRPLLALAQGVERLLDPEQVHGVGHLGKIEGEGGDAVLLDLESDVLVLA
jgi:hypothetical protein